MVSLVNYHEIEMEQLEDILQTVDPTFSILAVFVLVPAERYVIKYRIGNDYPR